jgi:lysozyme
MIEALDAKSKSATQAKRKLLLLSILGGILALSTLVYLKYTGRIWLNSLWASRYEVHGLDVSHHQGEINWQEVAATNDFGFVFMKATEGHDFTDKKFAYNWEMARAQGFQVGAYHFFSMRSSGQTQAAHFISVVPLEEKALAPVIDLEISLDHPPELVRQELRAFADALETHYGKQPILYVTYETYSQYVDGHFTEYTLWIRDVLFAPRLNREWQLWQYSNRGRVPGIQSYVDKNVLNTGVQLQY